MIIIDTNHIVGVYSSCAKCENFIGDDNVVCKAYPNGIPLDILNAEDLHKKPRKDQKNKIVFEAVNEK